MRRLILASAVLASSFAAVDAHAGEPRFAGRFGRGPAAPHQHETASQQHQTAQHPTQSTPYQDQTVPPENLPAPYGKQAGPSPQQSSPQQMAPYGQPVDPHGHPPRYNKHAAIGAYGNAVYPKYIYGFHSRELQNVGMPHGDNGTLGNGMTRNPW